MKDNSNSFIGSPSYYSEMATCLVNLIEEKRTVVYTDFVKDIAPLREKGLKSWSYHGKNMSNHDKVKAVNDWSRRFYYSGRHRCIIAQNYLNHRSWFAHLHLGWEWMYPMLI